MKIFFAILLLSVSFVIGTSRNGRANEENMKIKLTFGSCEVTVNLKNNPAVKQLIKMLPAKFEFRDFANKEKITNFPKPISLEDTPKGMVAAAGKMFIYVPWGNMGIFYKTHSNSLDRNLIELGEVENGLDCLTTQNNNFTAYIEEIK